MPIPVVITVTITGTIIISTVFTVIMTTTTTTTTPAAATTATTTTTSISTSITLTYYCILTTRTTVSCLRGTWCLGTRLKQVPWPAVASTSDGNLNEESGEHKEINK